MNDESGPGVSRRTLLGSAAVAAVVAGTPDPGLR
ncbi:twin-arginine translocation signal domain-containing protein [Kitasatospora purpeofusca]